MRAFDSEQCCVLHERRPVLAAPVTYNLDSDRMTWEQVCSSIALQSNTAVSFRQSKY